MTITGIKDNVQALLDNMGDFVTVLPCPPTETDNFSGYPAASHYYENTDPQYATVSQNRRAIQYLVELYIVPDKETTEATLFGEAYELIDKTIQMFDESRDLSNVGLSLPRACDMLRAAPSSLERISTAEGDGLMMTIRLTCEGDATIALD
jgi:hypothetical protein